MKFNVDRLSQLAGLPSNSGTLLSEAGNRSFHDDKGVSDESDFRYGKNNLAERGGKSGDKHDAPGGKKRGSAPGDEDFKNEEWGGKRGDKHSAPGGKKRGSAPGDEDFKNEDVYEIAGEPMLQYEEAPEEGPDEAVLEIDERMLAQEIRKMRRERLEENELRKAIRGEIQSVLKSLKGSGPKKSPRRNMRKSNRGNGASGVTRGFLGPGFQY